MSQPYPILKALVFHPNWPNYLKTSPLKELLDDPTLDDQTRHQLLYLLCFYDFELFVKTFFGAHCPYPFSQMHKDFFAAETDPKRRGRREVIAAPRGHAKTTFLVLFKCLHAIVYGTESFIVIIGHSAPEAEGKVKDILAELENNALLKCVYGQLAPSRGQPGYGTKNFVTQNGIRVMSKSRGKQVRGLKHGNHRPTLIILDDIESPDKVLNEAQRYKTLQWFEKDILKLGNVDGSANIFVIGTCLHPEALLPYLLSRASGWKSKLYQAVISFAKNQEFWQQWQAIYTDLTNLNREADADAFYTQHQAAMLEGTQVLWPEAEPYVRLMKLIINEGQASFQSEKQNDPYDPDRQIFNMAQAKRFRLEYQENGEILGIRWSDETNRYVPVCYIDRVIAFHDPAMGESPEGDYAAIVVCASDRNGYIYCLDAYIEKVPPLRQIEQAYALYNKWRFDRLYLEDNNFQRFLKSAYRDHPLASSGMMVSGYTQHANKTKRIASLEPLVSAGWLLINEDLTPRLISQMQLFPTSHDDGPDVTSPIFWYHAKVEYWDHITARRASLGFVEFQRTANSRGVA